MNVTTPTPASRRVFLRYAGATALTATVLLEACKNDDSMTTPVPTANAVDLGSGDVGILNYAFALEQLEAAFYTQVIATPFSGMTDAERAILTDLRDHEIIHREFLKAAIPAANRIADLQVNFQSITFSDRASVLNTAKAFEDLGVAAYNGAGRLIKDMNYLLVAGKIVSVEARHAAAIRDLLSPKTASFAGDDVVLAGGLDGAMLPAAVLPIAQMYVVNRISGASLPTA